MIHDVISDIKSLARERPLYSPEIYKFNDSYGHAHILKRYANIKENYQIKGIIEHAAMQFDHVWTAELSFPLPAHFIFSRYRFPFLRQLTNKALFALGPSIHYAEPLFTTQELIEIKKALGKTLLVFLPHSAMSLIVSYDQEKIVSALKRFEKEFDNILICLGWKDVLRGIEKPYVAEGYTCVTAGNVFDMNFLPRLKSLILIASHTMSFSLGTHIGFCIYLNRPHWVIPVKSTTDGPKEIKKNSTYRATPLGECQGRYILRNFNEPMDQITQSQRQVVDMIWGSSDVKTPRELREIFNITEDMFNMKYYPNNKRDPLIICQIIDYIQQGQIDKAEFLLSLARPINYHPGWVVYLKCLMKIKQGSYEEAQDIANSLKRYSGFFRKKADILLKINSKDKLNRELLKDLFEAYPRPNFYLHKGMDLPWNREAI